MDTVAPQGCDVLPDVASDCMDHSVFSSSFPGDPDIACYTPVAVSVNDIEECCFVPNFPGTLLMT